MTVSKHMFFKACMCSSYDGIPFFLFAERNVDAGLRRLRHPRDDLTTVTPLDSIPDLPPSLGTTIHNAYLTHIQWLDELSPSPRGKPQELILIHGQLPTGLADDVHLFQHGSVVRAEFQVDPKSACSGASLGVGDWVGTCLRASRDVVDESMLKQDREDREVVFGGREGDGSESCSRGVLKYCAEVGVERHCEGGEAEPEGKMVC